MLWVDKTFTIITDNISYFSIKYLKCDINLSEILCLFIIRYVFLFEIYKCVRKIFETISLIQ